MVSPLPIDPVLPELVAAVRAGNAVLHAPTGAGKTTRVPPALLKSAAIDGTILMLEPRRVAARAAAQRMADELGEALGETVGFQVRFERKASARTRILVMTEGVLLRRLVSDPFLEGVGAVILDEFHERSLDADLSLAMVRHLQRELRPELRIVVMSATLDVQRVAAFVDGTVVRSEGRAFPVEVRFTAADDVWLSTAHGRDSAYIAVHQYHRMEHRPYFDAFEAMARDAGGRPHWGKLHGRTRDDLQPEYARFDDFVAVRDRVDPVKASQPIGVALGSKPSMLQDILAGRPIEVEAILGQPLAMAREVGVATPLLEVVCALARGRNLALSAP